MPRVLVTGAHGFIAVPTIGILLDRGYDVVGTVHAHSKCQYLLDKFARYDDKLRVVVVGDSTTPGAFNAILRDHTFDAVLHMSNPRTSSVVCSCDIERDLYEPSIKNSTEILKSIHTLAPSVKRVVLTSSFAAMVDLSQGNRPGYVYSEVDWNPLSDEGGLEDPITGHYAAKTLAEKAAWDFIKKEKPHYALTTICPPMVYGPSEQEIPSIAKLAALSLYDLLNGLAEPSTTVWLWADVRDVALAHVLAIESDAAANQRYLIAEGRFSPQYFVNWMRRQHPRLARSKGLRRGNPSELFPEEGTYTANNSKSKQDLGLTYRSVETMLTDTFDRYAQLATDRAIA